MATRRRRRKRNKIDEQQGKRDNKKAHFPNNNTNNRHTNVYQVDQAMERRSSSAWAVDGQRCLNLTTISPGVTPAPPAHATTTITWGVCVCVCVSARGMMMKGWRGSRWWHLRQHSSSSPKIRISSYHTRIVIIFWTYSTNPLCIVSCGKLFWLIDDWRMMMPLTEWQAVSCRPCARSSSSDVEIATMQLQQRRRWRTFAVRGARVVISISPASDWASQPPPVFDLKKNWMKNFSQIRGHQKQTTPVLMIQLNAKTRIP